MKFWWQYCLDMCEDPLAPKDPSGFLSKFVIALRSTPKRGRLNSPVRLMPDDPDRRDPKTVAYRVEDVQLFFVWAKGAARVSNQVADQVAAFKRPRYDHVMTVRRLTNEQRATLWNADLRPRDRAVVAFVDSNGCARVRFLACSRRTTTRTRAPLELGGVSSPRRIYMWSGEWRDATDW